MQVIKLRLSKTKSPKHVWNAKPSVKTQRQRYVTGNGYDKPALRSFNSNCS